MSTIKEIAALAGVSRGTVDRVLNKRGSVSSEKEKKINDIAKALKYSPNLAGKTLAVKKKQLRFGYILFSSTSSNPFFLEVVRGIESRAAELSEYGVSVSIRYAAIDDPALQLRLVDELYESGIAGLAITPINHPAVAKRIKVLADSDFPVVTVNSDIPECGRIAYVGSDYLRSGETAAGLMNMICSGNAFVGIVSGSPLVLCHSERIAGFMRRIEEEYRGLKVVAAAVNNDDDIESYIVTKRLLEKHPETDALFLAAAGVAGACRAVGDMGLKGKVKILSFDVTAVSCEQIKSGMIAASITQEPFVQGAKPLGILLDYAGMGIRPCREFYYTSIGIVIKENLEGQAF
ncbi:MAG: LacI family DNA-binding transcriptional regulator [Oscillospiraceae bacterium]|jgi:LacI family transcriptional regulator|nr:LacI family DNA-binding transcriptional regulator [Oscillospiraceae bacterium]